MNGKQRRALKMIYDSDGCASCVAVASQADSYSAWINWQTAKALERRGLIEIDKADEWAISILPAGEEMVQRL